MVLILSFLFSAGGFGAVIVFLTRDRARWRELYFEQVKENDKAKAHLFNQLLISSGKRPLDTPQVIQRPAAPPRQKMDEEEQFQWEINIDDALKHHKITAAEALTLRNGIKSGNLTSAQLESQLTKWQSADHSGSVLDI